MAPPLVARINTLTRQVLENAETMRILAELGSAAWWTTSEDATAFRAAQAAMLAPIIRASGARVE